MLQSVGSQRVRHEWATEQQQLIYIIVLVSGVQQSESVDIQEDGKVVISACFPVQLLQLYMTTGKTIHILDCMEINYTPIKMYRTELKY